MLPCPLCGQPAPPTLLDRAATLARSFASVFPRGWSRIRRKPATGAGTARIVNVATDIVTDNDGPQLAALGQNLGRHGIDESRHGAHDPGFRAYCDLVAADPADADPNVLTYRGITGRFTLDTANGGVRGESVNASGGTLTCHGTTPYLARQAFMDAVDSYCQGRDEAREWLESQDI